MTEVTFEGLHTFALPLAQSTRKLLLPILIDMNLIKTVMFIECWTNKGKIKNNPDC